MGEQEAVFNVDRYKEVNLIADPLYGYIPFTKAKARKGEKTEEDLIDSKWVQRLRRIHQLQSAFWVFPSAEHTRFQHALGTMYLAGEFACHLYDSLVQVCNEAGEEIIPSQQLFEETARVAGLLHDIGHGPFGHFFDENYLADFGITHEDISQQIIKDELSGIIKGIRPSPSSEFESSERLDPQQIAHLIKKKGQEDSQLLWLRLLKKLFTGLYTADNLDFVRRDAYMIGVSLGPIDVERLKYYSQYCYRPGKGAGLALHANGVSALEMFLSVRSYMFTNVYCHRTVRAIELEMKDRNLFKRTTRELFPDGDPCSNLTNYCEFDEWKAMNEINRWATEPSVGEKKRQLASRWCPIIRRDPNWHLIAERREAQARQILLTKVATQRKLEDLLTDKIKHSLKTTEKKIAPHFRVDIVGFSPRPANPYSGEQSIWIYDPTTGNIEEEGLEWIEARIPARIDTFRVYSRDERYDKDIVQALNQAISKEADLTTSM